MLVSKFILRVLSYPAENLSLSHRNWWFFLRSRVVTIDLTVSIGSFDLKLFLRFLFFDCHFEDLTGASSVNITHVLLAAHVSLSERGFLGLDELHG